MTPEAITILQARRDECFSTASILEQRCAEAWTEYERRSRNARDAWREHAALCEAIDVLTQRGAEHTGEMTLTH